LVASCFGQSVIQDDDEIIVSEMEHHSNLIPWQMICTQKKAHLKILPMNDKAELNIQDLDKLISNKTKLISVTYVSNTLGTTNNIKAIIDRAHLDRIPVLVDGAQAVQHLPVDMQELDCDFFVFSGHKMYAGTGIGVLYGKEEWLDKLPPYQVGGGMVNSARLQKASFTSLPLKFEAGTPNIASAISLKKAIEYMSQIGLDSIHIHEQDLYSYLQNSLMEIEGLTIYGPKNNGIGSLSFNIAKCSPYDVGFILDKMGIAVRTGTHCAETVMQHYHIDGTVRASLGLYNTKEEIDHLLQGIKKAQRMLS
jgi:cysteine desulfurase/selenocysteine lyase